MNPIGQVVAAIASFLTLVMAYVIFGPLIDQTLAGLVTENINLGVGTMLDTNAGQLLLTVKIILMGWKLVAFFVMFAIIARLFIYLGFFTEEQGMGSGY